MGEKNKDDPILEIVKLEYQRCLKKYNFDFHVAKCLFNWHQSTEIPITLGMESKELSSISYWVSSF